MKHYCGPVLRKRPAEAKKSIRKQYAPALPPCFNRENPFSDDVLSLILDKSPFRKRKPKKLTIGKATIRTIFSDFEAFSICHGLKYRHLNHIARCFYQNKHTSAFTAEAHRWAMLALKESGPEFLSFVLTLPPLPFKAFKTDQIFSIIDKRKRNQQYPAIRVNFKTADGENEKIEISFLLETVDWKKVPNDKVLVVRNRTTGRTLMQISRSGKVVPDTSTLDIIPVLQFFVRFSKDARSMIINYGLETGECSICGRTLTDRQSIERGIGPVCFQSV